MSRLPAVLPVSFTLTSNSLPVTLPVKFGFESIDSSETITAATTSSVGRVVYAEADLSIAVDASAAVDRYVTASASTGVTAGVTPGTDRETFGSSSTDVVADVTSTDVTHTPSSNIAEITISAEFSSSAVVSTECSTSLGVTAAFTANANSGLFVTSSTAAQADTSLDLFHLAPTDTSLGVAVNLFSSLELWARASTHLSAGPVPQSLMDMLAVANATPLLVTVTQTAGGKLTAYVSSITAVDVDDFSSEQTTAVGRSTETIVVELDSAANTHVFGNTSRSITASITAQIRSSLVGNTELHVTDVPDSFLSRHQNLDSSTVVDVSTVAIGTLPLIYAKVQADDRHSTVAESLRMSVVTLSGRDSGVTVAQRTVSVPAEGDPRSAPVAMLTNSPVSRRSGSLFA